VLRASGTPGRHPVPAPPERIALTDSAYPFLEVTASDADVCLVLVDAEGEEAAGLCIDPVASQ
jgi:hypothetical protein